MVADWQKQVRKIEQSGKQEIAPIIEDIFFHRFVWYDLEKMQGFENRYRIRKGKYRIIFDLIDGKEPEIIRVQKRWDVYRGL